MKLGATDISKVYLGSTEVSKAYLGDTLVHGGATPVLPYDAEVAYLEGTGTQYIDTGLQINYMSSVVVEERCRLAYTVTNVRQLNGSNGYGFWGCTANNKFECAGGTSSATSTSVGTGWHDVSWTYKYENSKVHTILYVDNTKIKDVGDQTISNNYDYDIFIYAIGGRNDAAAQFFCKEKIAAYQIYFDNVLVRDYIPVRKDGVGYMYDKVSGQLFGNEGTGSFVVGCDKGFPYDAEVEYLESSGTQWIDTGLYGSNDLTTTLTFQLSSTSGSKGVFGVYESNKNYYVYQASTNYWQVGFGSYGNTSIQTNTNKHTMVFGNNSVALDGTTIFTGSGSSFTSTQTLVLFNMHNGSGGTYSATGMKVFGAKFEKNGVTVMDLIPVRTDGVGYMYDKVSGTLFGNAGSGAFTYGNDVV